LEKCIFRKNPVYAKSIEILETNVKDDHIHLVLSIPPRLSLSEVMGMLKGKTAIKIFQNFPLLKKKPYWETTSGAEAIVSVPSVWMRPRSESMFSTRKNLASSRGLLNLPAMRVGCLRAPSMGDCYSVKVRYGG